jgi:hypothetical protein
VEPRSVTFIADLLAAPEPEVLPTAVIDIPVGEPVIDQDRDEVLAVLDHLIACVNAGDYLRSFALFEDEYLRRIIDPDGLMTYEVAVELGKSFGTPEALDEQSYTTLTEINRVERLEDGSILVVFRTSVGSADDAIEQTDMFVFRKVGNAWLIVDGQTAIDQ